MKIRILSLIGFGMMLFGIFKTKFSISYTSGAYSTSSNFSEGYWLHIVIGLLLIIGTLIYSFFKSKEVIVQKKPVDLNLKWISSIRKLMQLGLILTMVGITVLLGIFISNQIFGIPQKTVEVEIPYTLSSEQINQIEQSKIFPEDATITDQKVMLNVGLEKIGNFSWLVFLITLIILGLIAYGIHIVIQILKSSEQGDFFTYLNAKRLKTIGHICIAYFILYNLLKMLATSLQSLLYGADTITFHMKNNIDIFILGLLLYVLAEIWKEGVKMQEDLKLTI